MADKEGLEAIVECVQEGVVEDVRQGSTLGAQDLGQTIRFLANKKVDDFGIGRDNLSKIGGLKLIYYHPCIEKQDQAVLVVE